MKDQIKLIEIYKWIESEKCGHDLGDKCIFEWIKNNAKEYREKWDREH